MRKILLPTIQKILWLLVFPFPASAFAQANAEPEFTIAGFSVEGESPLAESELRALLAPYTGAQRGVAGLQQAARQLEKSLRERGYGFYRVTLPPQEVGDTVRLKLLAFRIGAVEIRGNEHYSAENIRAAFPSVEEGATPNLREVMRNLAHANEHPGRQATITYAESATRDAIDARLLVSDTAPRSFFSTLQNNGNQQTGQWRLSLGYQHANLGARDQQLTLSYTTSPDRHHKDIAQYGVNWVIPWYSLAGTLALYAVYSDVNSGRVGGFFDVSGKGTFVGGRWTAYLLPVGDVSQTLSLGLDFKHYDNTVLFNGANQGSNVGMLPATAAYGGEWRQGWGKAAWSLDYSRNLSIGSDNDDPHYAANRAGARRQWDAWRGAVSVVWQSEVGWAVNARWRGQYADQPLVSGEQFGLGGAQSVRGYSEREVAGDRGYSGSVELWSAPLIERLRFLAFADGGRINGAGPQAGQQPRHDLASVGLGARWQASGKVGVAVDVAQAQRQGTIHQVGDWRGHVAITARF